VTVRHITGTYSAGYALAPAFSVADVASTGVIGGTDLSAKVLATVFNAGLIEATAYGATGVDLTGGGRLVNGSGGEIGGGGGTPGTYSQKYAGGVGGEGG
jgi:hypothetical protein